MSHFTYLRFINLISYYYYLKLATTTKKEVNVYGVRKHRNRRPNPRRCFDSHVRNKKRLG